MKLQIFSDLHGDVAPVKKITIADDVDVVITDIDMPGMDGFELTSAVRRDPRTASIPVIGLSSLVSAEAVERGRQVGLHDYVAKFDRPGLIAALKEQTANTTCAA